MDKYSYDKEIDALSLKKEEYAYAYSIEITDGIILDLNEKHNVIGLEILDASEILEISEIYLKEANEVNAEIMVTKKGIKISLIFNINNDKKVSNNLISGLYSNNLNSSFATT
ncbi:MAG: DUF2283 domain-containing protein [Methanosphaera sp.]|nr:DUF2283 domain-containing protein [Methanosphaera sp.]